MQGIIAKKRPYRFVIQDILLLHLKHIQYLTYEDYPPLTETEIITLNDLYRERDTYAEFLHDGNKYKLDMQELLDSISAKRRQSI